MKDRVREAVFNLLGKAVERKHAVDLFAGSGALGLEALSRGADRATLIERHFPTAHLIRDNVRALEVEESVDVVAADAFHWVRRELPEGARAWVVFCSPPYDLFVERRDDMLDLIRHLLRSAPAGSLLVVESDQRFDTSELPHPETWDVRTYRQIRVAILAVDDSAG